VSSPHDANHTFNPLTTLSIHERFRKLGAKITKGEELGIFQFGGSSIILAFEKGRIHFDDDLRECSKNRIQVAVQVGMSLGVATKGGQGRQGAVRGDQKAPELIADKVNHGKAATFADVVQK
jgi:hypothetical protein